MSIGAKYWLSNHMKTAFLDRDGTIVKDYPSKQWTHVDSPEFLEGSIEALKTFFIAHIPEQ